MKLSFIIVHYQVKDLLENCILSIKKYIQGIDYEIIVVDNNSPDPKWKELIGHYPDVKFIALEENYGFSKANNIGVSSARGEYVYILNPDTEIEGHYFQEILDFADAQEKFGALGLRMHDAKGEFLPESKRSIPALVNSFEKLFTKLSNDSKTYYRNDIGEFDIAEVEVMTGANLLMKKSVYEQVGGFDEQYFMYGEDIDLCYTILRNGFTNFYYGKYSILHYKGESTLKDKVYLERFFGAMDIFIKKYYRKQKPFQYLLMSLGLKFKHFIEARKIRN
ncbi:glycosyltransferase family 2 protein [Epilithonimonas lactis]|uniref:Glycosyl transferase family 2 n=1 Tax=Epilithonimonas lactis TaxID=421072 RepID=A0A085B7Y1_9FLAO|nr:glycosyltransferase family 2 protein [Epilithonimonas lactis]KFC18576.1 glycosyl transferase family 2 [Epilithonimonas lactis]KFC23091.1 glycosyl transferase family 2 [Epilithonimonas lactis]SEQ68204.1 Glycosyltransferase, GT2 family [Epilithonimonas lactis]